MKAVGIDGCKNGWVAVIFCSGKYVIKRTGTLDELLDCHRDADAILIDMPIGLPETKEEDRLRPEKIVRGHLGKRSCTVFNVPCRQAIRESAYERANIINKEVLGKGLSKQSFYISSKINELDQFLKSNTIFKNKLLESHPELLYKCLSKDNLPVILSKKTLEGFEERLGILVGHDKNIESIALRIQEQKDLQAIQDDVMDASVLAIACRLGLEHGFTTIPEIPAKDTNGLKMQMAIPALY